MSAGSRATPQLGSILQTLAHGRGHRHTTPQTSPSKPDKGLRMFGKPDRRNVVAVPNPNDDPRATYVVTAWQHELTIDSYDAETVHAFLSEFWVAARRTRFDSD